MNIDTPYLLAASDSKNFMVRKSLVRLALVCGKMAAKYLYWNLRGYSKARVIISGLTLNFSSDNALRLDAMLLIMR